MCVYVCVCVISGFLCSVVTLKSPRKDAVVFDGKCADCVAFGDFWERKIGLNVTRRKSKPVCLIQLVRKAGNKLYCFYITGFLNKI